MKPILMIICVLVLLSACASSQERNAAKAEKVTFQGLELYGGTTGTCDPDSLKQALELFSQAIELKPDMAEPYTFKALALCRLKRFDDALLTLSTGQKNAQMSPYCFMLQYYEAMIQDYTGDTVTAKLNYERAIEYIDYRLKKMPKDDHYYMAMSIQRIALLMLRYGAESCAEEIAALQSREDYTEGSGIWLLVKGFEDFDKDSYLSTIVGIVQRPKLPEQEEKKYEDVMWHRKR